MAILYYESQICHHGVKGQRWGVRRFQKPDGSLTAAGRRHYGRYGSTPMKMAKSGNRKLTTSRTREFSKDVASAIGQGVLSLALSTAGGLVHPLGVFTPVVISATRTAHDMNLRRKRENEDFVSQDGDRELVSKMAKLSKKETIDQTLNAVNAGKPKVGTGFEVNCASCSLAIDMRQKGYDVRARRQNHGLTDQEIAHMYKNAKVEHIPKPSGHTAQASFDNVVSTLKNVNNGNSSGIFNMEWRGFYGAGHSIYYKCNDGAVEFYDGQTKLSGPKLDKYFALADSESFKYIRTDNTKPIDAIGECVVSSKNDKLKKEDAE